MELMRRSANLRVPVIFCRELWRLRHSGKSGQLTPTPAMMAGLVDTLWTIGDLYDAVMKQQAEKKHRARVEKLLKKLRSLENLNNGRCDIPELLCVACAMAPEAGLSRSRCA
jgi:hypothetical protein